MTEPSSEPPPPPPSMPTLPPSLTLIVAAALTPSMGIGARGQLPWGLLKSELGYFARVTKRLPAGASAPNALIMGRKTWDSIPARRRPLLARRNIVVSRSPRGEAALPVVETVVPSFGAALDAARDAGAARVFVIGGAQIYQEALHHGGVERVLLTRVGGEWADCDVFFPLRLGTPADSEGWWRAGDEEMDQWVGEQVPRGIQREGEVEFEFMMFVRD